MAIKKTKEAQLLPGADAEADCQPVPVEVPVLPAEADADEEDDDHVHDVTWDGLAGHGAAGDGLAGWRTPRHGWSVLLEKLALAVERPANRLIGSLQFNPLYHTGSIATFLLLVVGLTGLYLFMFFQYGFDASYTAVARMEGQFIARAIRAIHRYASGALLITTLLHGYRTLFMERFRGPRWLAWVTGMLMTALVWGAGVTGYWLIWDQRAQLITDSFLNLLRGATGLAPTFLAYLTRIEGGSSSWPVLLVILAVHVLLFLVVAGFFWLHILRLPRPKWIPDVQWVVGLSLVLLIVSMLFPAGMLPQANPTQLPQRVTLDPIFLFFLPTSGSRAALLLWGGLLLAMVGLTALPWLSRAKRPSAAPQPLVNIIKDRCTGCTKCALDCPYGAIQMVERHDDKPHKYIAIEDTSLCVGCGICVGSCDGVAVTLGSTPPELMWDTVQAKLALAQVTAPPNGVKLIFTCERHATHGAAPFLNGMVQQDQAVEVVTLPCVGTAPPDLMTRALDAGAAEVQVVGCPPADCANREGNQWAEQRLVRERVPRLKRGYASAPVTALWLPPDDFAQAVGTPPAPEAERLESRRMQQPITWRNVAVSFVLLALVMGIQVLLTDVPFRPYAGRPAVARAILTDPTLAYEAFLAETAVATPVEFRFAVDGDVVASQTLQAADLRSTEPAPLVAEQTLPAGDYQLTLTLAADANPAFVLFDRTVAIAPGEIFRFGYDTGRTGACYGETCLKLSPAPSKAH
ncbi:MAG: hydrogenase iron-sulfur subunit [Anaerolineales bacterium]|nr:hydrogenase iron-sulfur subunit [Anaerolineales bacterium]